MVIVKDSQKMKVRIFFEVLGWPAEALTEHLKTTVGRLKKTWKITKEEYAVPEPLEHKNLKLLTTHVEFEAVVPTFNDLVLFCIVYGPSVVEIIEPSEIYITAGEIQDTLADVISKIQIMDKDVKVLAAQNKILKERLAEFAPAEEQKNGDNDVSI